MQNVAASSRRKFGADLMQYLLHGKIGGVEMLGQPEKMQVGVFRIVPPETRLKVGGGFSSLP
jgi:hypothetical protein